MCPISAVQVLHQSACQCSLMFKFSSSTIYVLTFAGLNVHGLYRSTSISERFISQTLDQSDNESAFVRRLCHKNAKMAAILKGNLICS